MIPRSSGAAQYQEMDVLSMTPGQAIVYLYAQLVTSLRRASRAATTNDAERRADDLSRAFAIVQELRVSLNTDAGPMAHQLAAIYVWFSGELMALSAKHDEARLTKLIELVAALHQAWDGAAQRVTFMPGRE